MFGYGYAVKHSIAYAFVPNDIAGGAPVEVDIFGTWVGGRITEEPLYDPKGTRIRS